MATFTALYDACVLYDRRSDSVVVGPVGFRRSRAPNVLEFGGRTAVESRRRGGRRQKRTLRIAARPYMRPALEKERSQLPAVWRNDEFLAAVEEAAGVPWPEVQNDPLVVDSLVPDIAHQMYPTIFRSSSSLSTDDTEFIQFANQRVDDMLELLREATGHEYIVFVVDEVGQYVGSRPNLILDLDGLAKNLKAAGDGKVWIIGTWTKPMESSTALFREHAKRTRRARRRCTRCSQGTWKQMVGR